MNLQFETITRAEALDYILQGLRAKRAEIDSTLRDLRSQLQAPTPVADAPQPEPRKRHKRSAAARKRMAEAQRQRWAKIRNGEV